ncbi:MAG: helix-turn-helix domain-containing protein [Actinomycetia bacterium]|nr:helix-turn-helix domain-containing protein [Actinomycetes bacterium]
MSVQALAYVFALGDEVSGARRLVLLALANFANEEGWCYPKVPTIARACGMSRKATVSEALSWLEEHGHIDRQKNKWSGREGTIPGDRRPNIYQLVGFPRGTDSVPAGYAESTPRGTHTATQNHHCEPSDEPPLDPPNKSKRSEWKPAWEKVQTLVAKHGAATLLRDGRDEMDPATYQAVFLARKVIASNRSEVDAMHAFRRAYTGSAS